MKAKSTPDFIQQSKPGNQQLLLIVAGASADRRQGMATAEQRLGV